MGVTLRVHELSKTYGSGDQAVQAVKDASFSTEPGEFVAVVGPSGSGKTTLLAMIGGLLTPTSGRIEVNGRDIARLSRGQQAAYRRESVGYVFQANNLLPYLTAIENIQLPMSFASVPAKERVSAAKELLDVLGIPEIADRRLGEMSGGQQQRVALGVALANRPTLLLADEPTGELDSRSSDEVFSAIRAVNDAFGTTVIVVTHDPLVSEQVTRTVGIRDGRTSSEVHRRTALDAEGREMLVTEEYAVLDRAGRLQLPAAFTSALDLKDRVRLGLEPDHIGVWPGASTGAEAPASTPAAGATEDSR